MAINNLKESRVSDALDKWFRRGQYQQRRERLQSSASVESNMSEMSGQSKSPPVLAVDKYEDDGDDDADDQIRSIFMLMIVIVKVMMMVVRNPFIKDQRRR